MDVEFNRVLVESCAGDERVYRPEHVWAYNKKDKVFFDGEEYIVYKGYKESQHEIKAFTPNIFRHDDFAAARVGDRFPVEHVGQVFYGYKFFAHGLTNRGYSLMWVENGNSFPLEYARLVADFIGTPFKIKDPNKANEDKKGRHNTGGSDRLGRGVQREIYEFYRPGKI